jgi:O-antigen/teichoic acid export membrane protein
VVSTLLCIQVFSLESFGELSYVVKSANIISFLANLGISYALNQYPMFINEKFKALISIYFVISLINLIFSSVYFKNYSKGKYFLVGILLAQSLGFLLLYYGYLNGNLENKIYAAIRIVQSIVPILFLTAYYLSEAQISPIEYLWIVFIIYCSIIIISFIKNARNIYTQNKVSKQKSMDTSEFINFGKNSYLIQIYRCLHLNLDFMILGFIITSASLAEYSIALSLALAPQIYIASKQISAQTNARDSIFMAEAISKARSVVIRNVFISISFLACEMLIIYYFHNFIFEEDITNILILLLILAPASTVDSSGALFGNLLIGFNKNKIYSKIQFHGFILNLLLILFGVGLFGVYGAAIASLISYSFVLLSTIRALGKNNY